jgi:hypothetical protein
MAQQTAIEWFVEQLEEFGSDDFKIVFKNQFEQAKAMEKEQIMDAYWNGTIDIDKKDALIEAEFFYKETYKK